MKDNIPRKTDEQSNAYRFMCRSKDTSEENKRVNDILRGCIDETVTPIEEGWLLPESDEDVGQTPLPACYGWDEKSANEDCVNAYKRMCNKNILEN